MSDYLLDFLLLFLPLFMIIGYKLHITHDEQKANTFVTGMNNDFTGFVYNALNNIYVFENNMIFYGYEIYDFKDTVESEDNDLMIVGPRNDNNEFIDCVNVIEWPFDKEKLSLEEQTIVDVIQNEPLSDNRLNSISKSILAARKDYELNKEIEDRQKFREKYQSANYNDERHTLAQHGVQSTMDYTSDLNEKTNQYLNTLDNERINAQKIINNALEEQSLKKKRDATNKKQREIEALTEPRSPFTTSLIKDDYNYITYDAKDYSITYEEESKLVVIPYKTHPPISDSTIAKGELIVIQKGYDGLKKVQTYKPVSNNADFIESNTIVEETILQESIPEVTVIGTDRKSVV